MACFTIGTERRAAVSMQASGSYSRHTKVQWSCRCATRLTVVHAQLPAVLPGTQKAAGCSFECNSPAVLDNDQHCGYFSQSHSQQLSHVHDRMEEPPFSVIDQQQQTYWLPHVHSHLLQSQLQPAHQVHQQLLSHHEQQQQRVQKTANKRCTEGSMVEPSRLSPTVASTHIGLSRGMSVVAITDAPAAEQEVVDALERSAASEASAVSSQSSGTTLRERMRQHLAAKASQSGDNKSVPAVQQLPLDADASDPAKSLPNNSSSSSDIRARLRQQLASRSGAAAGSSNDSSIAAVLQQLQKKLGQQHGGKTKPQQAVTGIKQQQAEQAGQPTAAQLQSSLEKLKGTSGASIQQNVLEDTSGRLNKRAKPPPPPPPTLVDMLQSQQLTCTWDKVRTLSPEHERSWAAISRLQASTAAAVTDLQSTMAKTGAPEAVQMRLIWDWQRNPALPADLEELQQKLVPFQDMASLLGGADIAAEILSKDSALMILQQQQLQARLLNLQQLVGAETAAQTAEDMQQTSSRSSSTGASLSGNTGSNLAAIRERLLSRQQLQGDNATALVTVGVQGSNSNNNSSSNVTPEVLSLVRAAPGILMMDIPQLQQRLAAVQKALGLSSDQDVLQVLRHQPLLLDVRVQKLEAKTLALAASLELPLSEVGCLFRKQPLLLNLSASGWPKRVNSLKDVLALPKRQLLELVTAKPGVLMYNPEKLRAKSVRLQSIAGSHKDWDAEFRGRLSPGSLVQLLTVGEERLLRAEYLVSIKAQHKQSMLYTIQVQKAHYFKKKFPGFDKWYKEWKQQNKVAVETKGDEE